MSRWKFSFCSGERKDNMLLKEHLFDSRTMQQRELKKLYIELCTRCHNNCKHCYFSEYKNAPELSFSEILHMQSYFRQIGVLSLTYAGAEPILREDMKEIILNGKKLGFSQTFCTRGLIDKQPELEAIINLFPEHIQFSVDPSLSGNSLDDEITRIREIGKCTSKYSKTYISWVITLTTDFPEYSERLLDEIYKSGAHELRIHKVVANKLTQKEDNLFPSKTEYIEYMTSFANLFSQKHNEGQIEVEECISVSKLISTNYHGVVPIIAIGCPIGHSALTINHLGHVYLCPLNKNKMMMLGDNWKEILQYWDKFNTSNKFCRDNFKNVGCSKCRDFELCLGGCRCQAITSSGDFWGKDPNCVKEG